MAIPRLSVKVGKVGKAQPHAAYIARQGQYANRTERGEVLEATGSGNMPAWAEHNPLTFWDASDSNERINGSTYREFEIALPRELSPDQRLDLLHDFIKQEIGTDHAYQYAIHTPRASDGDEQPHAHLMFSERRSDGIERDPEQYFKRYNGKNPERGGCKKGYGVNAGKKLTRTERTEELKNTRKRWETLCNDHLEKSGSTARIDMRSYKDQGLDLEPERKYLPSEWRNPEHRETALEMREYRKEYHRAKAAFTALVPDIAEALNSLKKSKLADTIETGIEKMKARARQFKRPIVDKEEQILGLIAAASEQQEAVTQAIEHLNTSRKELHSALASQQNKLADDHREVITQHRKQFDGIHTDIQKVLHWLPMVGSIVVTGICCLAIVAMMFWYLGGVMDDITEARANRTKLEALNPEIRQCLSTSGAKQPCIAVDGKDETYKIDGKIFKVIRLQ
ncbi:unnamed protein product [Cyprideis torosa]|uniref:Uncharacterized protein n=1 Tax=Cyprideis torosa TaxID=163714 RepID=A0A7R8ZW34_9CRUS|nr:unnamed protein product [Cyprideis torosa]CAG0904454.1 unnamed protein product [Cyprideis torosa]